MVETVRRPSPRQHAGRKGSVLPGTGGRIRRLVLVLVSAATLLLTAALARRAQSGARPVAVAQGAVISPNIAPTPTVGGLAQPIHVTHAGDGSGRLFVVEKAGVIRIVRNGGLEPLPFLSITSRVGSTGGE